MTNPIALIRRFPEHELAIHRLCSQELGFMGVCEDYEEAAIALRRWEEAGPGYVARANEYRTILGEIETEIHKDISKYLQQVMQQGN